MDDDRIIQAMHDFLLNMQVQGLPDPRDLSTRKGMIGAALGVICAVSEDWIAREGRGSAAPAAARQLTAGATAVLGSRIEFVTLLGFLVNFALLDEADAHPDDLALQGAAGACVAMLGLLEAHGNPTGGHVDHLAQAVQGIHHANNALAELAR